MTTVENVLSIFRIDRKIGYFLLNAERRGIFLSRTNRLNAFTCRLNEETEIYGGLVDRQERPLAATANRAKPHTRALYIEVSCSR